jgi:hypothetical protein
MRNIFLVSIFILFCAPSPGTAQSGQEVVAAADVTGNWFNPGRDGEGCNLTLEGDNQSIILTCYSYLDKEQVWMIGSGTLGTDGNDDRLSIGSMVITSGAQFGSAFHADDVVREVFGGVVMQFTDCNSASITFDPIDPRFTRFETAYQKIVPGACNGNPLESTGTDAATIGNWFDPARDGEGIQVALEADGSTYVATYYTYLNGEQAWLIGTGRRDGTTIRFDDMTLTGGADYGPAFNPADVTRTPWGRMVVDIADCSRAKVSFDSDLPQFESFSVDMVKIVQGPCRALTLKGRVVDDAVVNATVIATVGDRIYETVTDENGNYELRVVVRSADEFVRLSARGSEAQPTVRFESMLGGAGRLIAEAGNDAVLSSAEDAQTDITHFTTAQFALVLQANQGSLPADDARLSQLAEAISIDDMIWGAAFIRLVVDGGRALPAGVADTLALLASEESMQSFFDSLSPDEQDQAYTDVLDNAPSSVAFTPESIPSEAVLYVPSPLGTVPPPGGGVVAMLQFDHPSAGSGTLRWVDELLNTPAGLQTTWTLENGVVTAIPATFRVIDHRTETCVSPGGIEIRSETFTLIDKWELRRVARADVDSVELRTYWRTFQSGVQKCNIQQFGHWKRGLLAFKSDRLPFAANDLHGARALPYLIVPADESFRRTTSAVFNFDTAQVEAPGLQSGFDLSYLNGRIVGTLTNMEGQVYGVEYRRYRSDGRKGDAVVALVTGPDGASAVVGGMSVAVDPDFTSTDIGAPTIYRSGLELGNFRGVSNGSFPFFIQLDTDGEVISIELGPTKNSPRTIGSSTWAVEDGRVVLRRIGGPANGARSRDWTPVAMDGNRMYVLERLYQFVSADDPESQFVMRSNFYDIVDEVQFERP